MAGIATTKHEYAVKNTGKMPALPAFSYELHVRRLLTGPPFGRHEAATGLRFLIRARGSVRVFRTIPVRFHTSENGGRGGPPSPNMVGAGVPAGPFYVTC